MNAVGIDVSKGKSTVTILQPGEQFILKPCDFHHTQTDINSLIKIIKELEGDTKYVWSTPGGIMSLSPIGLPMPAFSSVQ